MFRTLRGRFIVSHLLPLLVVVPLMGIALTYVLETQVMLDSLSRELVGQALLVAGVAGERADIWLSPVRAQAFVSQVYPFVGARVMLLDAGGHLLASSDVDDLQHLGEAVDIAGWSTVVGGEVFVRTSSSRRPSQEVVDVLVPIVTPARQLVGVVRLSYPMTGVFGRFQRLRAWIVGILVAGLLLGIAAGWLLALNLKRPLEKAAAAVSGLANGQPLAPLPEHGPREVENLLRSVNSLVERLGSVEQARRQLLANLIHELGRPLGALRSAIEALRSGADEEPALRHELTAGMEQEVKRLARLVEDLAGLHGQVLGTLRLDRRPTPISEWLANTLVPWREAAQAKGLAWESDVAPGLPVLEVDADRLAQALGNLLSNAVKYTAKGTISVHAGLEDGAFHVRVCDTGPGIPPEDQERVFSPFFRGQPGRRFPQGMGLGLSIARDLVVAHGGRLEVESSLGRGSCFTIRLPLPTPAQA